MAEPSDVLVSQQEGYVVQDDLVVEQLKARQAERDEIQRQKNRAAYEKGVEEKEKRAQEVMSTLKFGEPLHAFRTSELGEPSDKRGKSVKVELPQQEGYVVQDDAVFEKEKARKAQRDEIQRQKDRAKYEKEKEEEKNRAPGSA